VQSRSWFISVRRRREVILMVVHYLNGASNLRIICWEYSRKLNSELLSLNPKERTEIVTWWYRNQSNYDLDSSNTMENSLRLIQLVYNIIHKLSCLVLALTSIYPNYINHALVCRVHKTPIWSFRSVFEILFDITTHCF
jgi:hypothetical protein